MNIAILIIFSIFTILAVVFYLFDTHQIDTLLLKIEQLEELNNSGFVVFTEKVIEIETEKRKKIYFEIFMFNIEQNKFNLVDSSEVITKENDLSEAILSSIIQKNYNLNIKSYININK